MNKNEHAENMAIANFGDEVDQFLKSQVGMYLLGRAERDAAEAMLLLKDCDPNDWKTVQKLQNSIKLAENVEDWLKEAVAAGLDALQILEERTS